LQNIVVLLKKDGGTLAEDEIDEYDEVDGSQHDSSHSQHVA